MSAAAAAQGRFARPGPQAATPLSQLFYAFHFDANLYAQFLRGFATRNGVRRIEGKITRIDQRESDGFITTLHLDNGQQVEGDLFIDCTGFRSMLLGETLGVGFEDWSHWLPVNRAWAVPTGHDGPIPAHTRSTAHGAGWQWRIPLQHRVGNGHVYCNRFISDDEAQAVLRQNLRGEMLDEPRPIAFTTGRRQALWSHNVVALGLAGGFLEPLESTSIHLVQNGIARLFSLFPDMGFAAADRDAYNRGMCDLYDDVRDFIILHYKATQRDDTPFWRHVRTMEIPETLARNMEMFQRRGRVFREGAELFGVTSWVAVMLGQNMRPAAYDPLVDSLDPARVSAAMGQMRAAIASTAAQLPTHEQFLRAAGIWNDSPAGAA